MYPINFKNLDMFSQKQNMLLKDPFLLNSGLSNGFGLNSGSSNFECFGYAFSPVFAKQALEKDIPTLRKAADTVFKVEIDHFAEAANQWIDLFYNVQPYGRGVLRHKFTRTPPTGCNKDGLDLLINTLDNTKNELITKMRQVALQKGGRLITAPSERLTIRIQGKQSLIINNAERFKIILNKPKVVAQEIKPQQSTEEITASVTENILKKLSEVGVNPAAPAAEVENKIPLIESKKSGTTPLLVLGIAAAAYIFTRKRKTVVE